MLADLGAATLFVTVPNPIGFKINICVGENDLLETRTFLLGCPYFAALDVSPNFLPSSVKIIRLGFPYLITFSGMQLLKIHSHRDLSFEAAETVPYGRFGAQLSIFM